MPAEKSTRKQKYIYISGKRTANQAIFRKSFIEGKKSRDIISIIRGKAK